MLSNPLRGLVVLALAGPLILSTGQESRGQQDPAASMNMPGMEMAKPPNDAPTAGQVPPQFTEVNIPLEVQQRIGVTLGKATETPLTMNIRTVGIVRPNETKVAHVHIKTEGWVEQLFVSFTGQNVKAGDPLLSIYSPQFFAAEREFLTAMQSAKSGLSGMGDPKTVLETARRRLELWDVPAEEIRNLETTGKPGKALMLRSPISGTVLEKNAFEGQYVMAQTDLYVVADLSTVWVQAKVYEYELPHVELGMPVTVTFPSLPMQRFAGKVVFVNPVMDEMTRTAQVRVELPNPSGQFRPGMFAHVLISHAMGSGLTVPASAIIRTGGENIAFRAVSTDRFVPVRVIISPLRFEDRFQILEGLQAGDQVVTSANFLLDSESQLQAGGGGMAGMAGMEMGGESGSKKPAVKPHDMKEMPEEGGPAGKPDHSMMKH